MLIKGDLVRVPQGTVIMQTCNNPVPIEVATVPQVAIVIDNNPPVEDLVKILLEDKVYLVDKKSSPVGEDIMFIKVVRLVKRGINSETMYYLHEISLNANHIAFLTENIEMKSLLNEGKIHFDLHPDVSFTDVKLSSGKEITVVGSTSMIESKISKSNKKILRG